MLRIRKSKDRGFFDHGWLQTHHTFSFGDYYDAEHMGFRKLRVINEDFVQPSKGFGTHPHRDMEIITYIVSGELEHKDSMGNGSIIRPGEVQRMTAGTGVTHSEFNPSKSKPVHLLQIWIFPEKEGLEPGYEQKAFSKDRKQNRLLPVASTDGREGTVAVHQDVGLYIALLDKGTAIRQEWNPERHAWVQVVSGEVEVNGSVLQAGDGAALSGEGLVALQSNAASEVLVFDLA